MIRGRLCAFKSSVESDFHNKYHFIDQAKSLFKKSFEFAMNLLPYHVQRQRITKEFTNFLSCHKGAEDKAITILKSEIDNIKNCE